MLRVFAVLISAYWFGHPAFKPVRPGVLDPTLAGFHDTVDAGVSILSDGLKRVTGA